jgi:hypothetical protein
MLVAALVVSITGVIGFLDPAWAPAANTAFIITLAVFHAWEARRARRAEAKAEHAELAARDAKRAAGATRRDESHRDTGERRRVTD